MTGYRMFSKYHLIRETTKQEKSPTGMMVKLWSKVKSDLKQQNDSTGVFL